MFGLIFWLVLGSGTLILYNQSRRHGGWAAFLEVALGIIGAAAAESAVRLSTWKTLQHPLLQILVAIAGALLLAFTARWLIPRRS